MKDRENAKYIKWGLTAAAVIGFGILFWVLVFDTRGLSSLVHVLTTILRPFIYGAVIAYLVTPLSRRLSKWLEKPLGVKRAATLGNLLGLLVVLIVVLAVFLLIVPQLINSIAGILNALPGEIQNLSQEISKLVEDNPDLKETWEDFLSLFDSATSGKPLQSLLAPENLAKLMGFASGAAYTLTSIAGVLKDLFLGLIVSLYLLSRRAQLSAQARLILRGTFKPAWADWLENEIKYADRMFNGFFVGKLLDSAIVGVICFIGCLAMGFSAPLLIAVIVGVTNIIPFFGPFIGAIPCALLLLLENPTHCLMFLVFVVILQQLDGNVIGPKILGDSTGLSALWVMFAILLFGGLWGIVGMLIGVPLMAVIYDIVRQLTFKGVRRHGREDMIEAYMERFHS